MRAENAKEAEQAFNEALLLKAAGKPSDVITLCGRVARDYPGTLYAEKANDLSAEMQKLNDDAHARAERRKPSPARAASIR